MAGTRTPRKLHISTNGTAGPYIMVPVSQDYLFECWEAIKQTVLEVSDAASKNFAQL